MKILLITQQCGERSGWERYSSELAAALRMRGHAVDILAARGEAQFTQPLPDPLRYKFLILASRPLAWWFWRSHRRELRQYDCIHCVIEPYAPFARAVSRYARKPYVLTVHGSFGVKTLTGSFEPLQRQAYADAARIVCVSAYTERMLIARVPGARTIVIPNGVNAARFAAVEGQRSHLLFSAGAVKPRKGQHLVLEAFARVRHAVPDARYVIAGDLAHREYVHELRKKIAALGLERAVELAGRVPEERLRELYATAAAFVLTPVSTPTDFEGFGLVYLEANAAGLPVVGMEGSGAVDAIADGRSGLIAKTGDVDDLAQKLIEILTDTGLHERLSQGARVWAREHDWSAIVPHYEAVYGAGV